MSLLFHGHFQIHVSQEPWFNMFKIELSFISFQRTHSVSWRLYFQLCHHHPSCSNFFSTLSSECQLLEFYLKSLTSSPAFHSTLGGLIPSSQTISSHYFMSSMRYFPNNYSKEQIQLHHFLDEKLSALLKEKQIHINDSLQHWRPSKIDLVLIYHILHLDVDLLFSPCSAPQLLWKHLNSASLLPLLFSHGQWLWLLWCRMARSDRTARTETFYKFVLTGMRARSHRWLSNPWHAASATGGLNSWFYLMLMNLITKI